MKKRFIVSMLAMLVGVGSILTGCDKEKKLEKYDMSGVSFNDSSFVYDGNEHSIFLDGVLPEGLEVEYLNNNQINVGTYEVTANFIEESGYEEVPNMKANMTIVKSSIEGISFVGKTVTYTGEEYYLEISGELPEGVTVEYINNGKVNAGTYEVTAVFTDTTGNYNDLPELKATLTINKATYDMSGISFNGKTVIYDGNTHSLEIEGQLPSGVEVSYTSNNQVNVGTYTVTASFTHDNPNYESIPSKEATLVISKATITGIEFNGKTFTYDGNVHSLEISGTLPEGVTVEYFNNGKVDAGTYEVTAVFTDSTGNYNDLPELKATLTINKTTYDMSCVSFNGKTVIYDGNTHSLEIEGQLPSEVEVSYTNNNQVNVGTYTVTASFTHDNPNYESIPSKEATLVISKATITGIEFNGKTFTYDGNVHLLVIEGQLPEGVTVEYINNGQVNAGTYEVTAVFTDSTGNYNNLPDMKATLTIVKDGLYHDLIIIYEDGSIEEKVVEHGYIIEYLETPNKEGYTGYYVDKTNNEKISFPYNVNEDVIIEYCFEPNTYKVNYFYQGKLLKSDEVQYNSNYTLIESYINNEGLGLIELVIDNKKYNTEENIKFTYLNDINVEMIFVEVSTDFNFYIDSYGNVTIGGYNGSYDEEQIIIPSYVSDGKKCYKATHIGSFAFYNKYHSKIIISEGITTINDTSFARCHSLKEVILPNTLINIGREAFSTRSMLNNIIIPESVKSIGYQAFLGCKSLTSMYIPKGVTYIGDGVFGGCVNLKSIEVDSENLCYKSIDGNLYTKDETKLIQYSPGNIATEFTIPSKVTTIGIYSFYGSINLIKINIPKSIISIGAGSFCDCSSLLSIDIPETVVKIGNSFFEGCSSLTSIIIPKGVTSIGRYAFRGCSSLTSIDIPESVTSIGDYAFRECSSLTSITFPNTLTSIGYEAFRRCSSLTSILIPKGVTSIGNSAFIECNSLKNIEVDLENLYYKSIDGNLYNKEGTELIRYSIGKQEKDFIIPEMVTSIGNGAFWGCNLITVTFRELCALTNISYYAFFECRSLTSIVIPESVTSIGYAAFSGCDSLTIYCEVSSKPSGWDSDWNDENRPVYYAGEWEYVNGVPTPII